MLKTLLVGLALAVPPLATSAAIRSQEAVQRVLQMERDHSAFMVKFPSFTVIEETLRDECAARAPGKSRTGGYCTCAAAVTMGLWRSGIDPKMLDRLTAFANRPDPTVAQEFLKYQDPELYAPLCTAARLAD